MSGATTQNFNPNVVGQLLHFDFVSHLNWNSPPITLAESAALFSGSSPIGLLIMIGPF